MTRIHASCVAIGGRAVLLAGPSGAGKSDLALRLIDRGAVLVADDYTELEPQGGRLIASSPPNIAGRMEVRGVGILDVEAVGSAPVCLFADLGRVPERMPKPATVTIDGIDLPMVALAPLEPSAPIKLERALDRFGLALG
jgi:hypothetical protein